jgi:hypothetical protein
MNRWANQTGKAVSINPPIAITCPDDITITLAPGECGAMVSYAMPVATGGNGVPTVVQTSGLASGNAFPIGSTTNCFIATDDLGITATCCFTVTVQEFPNPNQSLSCNGLATLPLDQNCQGVLTAGAVLEGGPYGCYENYVVDLDKTVPYGNGPWVPAEVDLGELGKTYQYRVTDPVTGNRCWGDLKVVDELPPVVTCADISVDCNGPGLTPPTTTDCQTVTLTWNDIAVVDNFPAQPNKIITRKWTATDASGNTATCIQTVSVTDNGGPVANCPTDMTVSTDPYTCCATVDLPDVILENISGGIANTTAIIFVRDQVTGDTFSQIVVPGVLSDFPGNNPNDPDTLAVFGTYCLPLGQHDVAYLACGNSAYCTFRLTVEDNTPPVVACDEFTIVTLGADCMALVDAAVFDDGSYDNCGDAYFKVRRLGGNGCEPDDRFYDQMKFCSADLGQTLQIVLRVYGVPVPAGGVDATFEQSNANECIVEVEVQDKIKPTCTAPAPVTVACENFDPTLFAYGFATGTDNCCLDTITVTNNYALFDTVCNRGTLTRTFTAMDCGGQTKTCTQRIIVNYAQNYFVKFPNDVIVTACDPNGNYGEPVPNGEDCELFGLSYVDTITDQVPDACYKIFRTWTVINWCTYNPNLGCTIVPNPNPHPSPNHPTNRPGPTVSAPGTTGPWAPTVVAISPGNPPTNFSTFWSVDANCYKYTQVINILDSQDPVVENCPVSLLEICDFTPNDSQLWNESYWFDNAIGSQDLCEGQSDLTITATDLCSGSNITIRYQLFLDLDNNGSMETVVNSADLPGFNTINFDNAQTPNFSGGTPRAFDERPVPTDEKYGFALQTTLNGNKKVASVRWNTQQAPGTYSIPELPYGTHKIKWFVQDACGNEKVCEYAFVVKDCKAPTVVCINGLSVNMMPTGIISLWGSDFLQYTEDNCTPGNQLVTAIRKAGAGTGFPRTPDGQPIKNIQFGTGELGVQYVEIWSQDAAGNADYCLTSVVVCDPNGFSGGQPSYPDLTVCAGENIPGIPLSGPIQGASYTWTNDNPGIGLAAMGTGDIPSFTATNNTPDPLTATIHVDAFYNGCSNPVQSSFTITVNPAPVVLDPGDQALCPGKNSMAIEFMGSLPGMTYEWTNDNPAIGLAASGTGDIPAFAAVNNGVVPVTAHIQVLGIGAVGLQCPAVPTNFEITVYPVVIIDEPDDQVLCAGESTAAVQFVSNVPGTAFMWTNDNPAIGLAASGMGDIPAFAAVNNGPTPLTANIQFLGYYGSAGISCVNPAPMGFTITVNPAPVILDPGDQALCAGENTKAIEFMGSLPGMTYEWTNDNPAIGLAASGTGDIPAFAAVNNGVVPLTAHIHVLGIGAVGLQCPAVPTDFYITVNPASTVADPDDQVLCAGENTAAVHFAGNIPGTTFRWTNDSPGIGLPPSGTGDIAAFTAANYTGAPITATITVTPQIGDRKKPTVVCLNGLSVNIMPTGMIALWASDFLQYVEDNITPSNLIKIGIRKSGKGSGFPTNPDGSSQYIVTFDCSELGIQAVELWAQDECGNTDYCETYVIVQNNFGTCNGHSISGKAVTEYGDGVQAVEVTVTGPGVLQTVLTDDNGDFMFPNLPTGQSYEVCMSKNDNALNGVNSYDLVLMSRHILGLETLNSPYKLIAADVNLSGTITEDDIVQARELILGISTDLPAPSWQFVPADVVFPNPANPFEQPFQKGCKQVFLSGNATGVDFIAIKTADLDGTAVANDLAPAPAPASANSGQQVPAGCDGCPGPPVVFTITVQPSPSFTIQPTSPSCDGATDGVLEVTNLTGQAPYQYALNGGGFQNNPVFGGLGLGIYTITVQGANGCTSEQQTELTQGPDLPLAIQCPTNIPALTANSSCRAFLGDYTGLAALSGSCGIPLNPIVQTPAPGTVVNPGTVAITLTVSNVAGQIATCRFNVVVSGGCGH